MLKNYFKITLRNFHKRKGLTFINIFGLGLGLACCIGIMLFVRDEMSYEQYHKQREQVFSPGDGGEAVGEWRRPPKRDAADSKNPLEISFAEKKFNESNLLFAEASALSL